MQRNLWSTTWFVQKHAGRLFNTYNQANSGWFARNLWGGPLTKTPDTLPDPGGSPLPLSRGLIWDYGPVCGNFKMLSNTSFLTSSGLTNLAQAANDNTAGIVASAVNGVAAVNANDLVKGEYSAVNTPGNYVSEYTAYNNFDQKRAAAFSALISAVRTSNLPATIANSEVCCGQASGLQQTGSGAQATAQAYTQLQQIMGTGAQAFNDAIGTASASVATDMNTNTHTNFSNSAKTLGWASAGAMNFTLARISANVHRPCHRRDARLRGRRRHRSGQGQ